MLDRSELPLSQRLLWVLGIAFLAALALQVGMSLTISKVAGSLTWARTKPEWPIQLADYVRWILGYGFAGVLVSVTRPRRLLAWVGCVVATLVGFELLEQAWIAHQAYWEGGQFALVWDWLVYFNRTQFRALGPYLIPVHLLEAVKITMPLLAMAWILQEDRRRPWLLSLLLGPLLAELGIRGLQCASGYASRMPDAIFFFPQLVVGVALVLAYCVARSKLSPVRAVG